MSPVTETPETLLSYPTVQRWLVSLQHHRRLAPQELQDSLQSVAAFCTYVGQSPEAIISQCLRDMGAGKGIDSRSRRYYMAQIEAFQRQSAAERRQQVAHGRAVRGFLIHNGVMLQVAWQYRGRGST